MHWVTPIGYFPVVVVLSRSRLILWTRCSYFRKFSNRNVWIYHPNLIYDFNFTGKARPPFEKILEILTESNIAVPIVSVDIPSGWDVEEGDKNGTGLKPKMLVCT